MFRKLSVLNLGLCLFVVVVIVIVALALTGPSVGNVFSQVYHSCGPGCGNFYSSAPSNGYAPPAPPSVAPDTPSDSGSEPMSYADQERVVLKNATLTLTVANPAQTITQVTQLAEGIGGWVVSSNTTAGTETGISFTNGTVSVRVPADKFAVALEQIKSGAVSVDGEVITGDDVTQKYVDLNSQLTNLQSTEAQLQKIMTTAAKVDDVLSVQAKLTDVQGQIEQIKGQLNYFSQAAAYSLIALTLNQKPPDATLTAVPTPAPLGIGNWKPADTVRDAASLLIGLAQTTVTLVLWLGIIGLPFAGAALVAFVIWRRLKRMLPKSKWAG